MSFRSPSPPSQEWSDYLKDVQSMHCPYLAESRRQALLTFSVYTLECSGSPLQELSLGVALVHAEILRAARLEADDISFQRLICENLILRSTAASTHECLLQLHWTHWALKALYTEAGLAFGKFWPHEQSLSKSGAVIADPPETFLSIRPTIIKPDIRFFSRSKTLAKKHLESSASAAAVFKALGSRPLSELRSDLERDPLLAHSADFVTAMAKKLAEDCLLKRVLAVDGLASVLS